jgi:long-chain acyl-CoA synthetase
VPYPARTLVDFTDDGAREGPGDAAILFKGRTITFAELQRASDAFAVALASLGVRRGDRVGALLPNCPQFLIVELAAWKLGAMFAPLNPIYSDEELAGPLNTSEPDIVVTLTPFYDRLKRVQSKTKVKRIITSNIKEWFPPLLRIAFTFLMEKKGGYRITHRDGDLSMADLLKKFDGQRPTGERPKPADGAVLLMSGGTSGAPKCVIGSHEALVMSGLQLRAWLGDAITPRRDVFMLPLPLFHAYGTCAVQSLTLIGRNPLSLIPDPRNLNDIVESIAKIQPVAFAGVPTLFNALANHADVKSGKVSFRSIKVCASGAAPLLAETRRRFEEATGVHIIEGYGMTESLIAAVVNPLKGVSKDGALGMPLPDVDVRIVDVEDPAKVMPMGEVGEMLLTAPQIMKGYFRNPEATAETLYTDAGGVTWIRTGDLCMLDGDGYVFLVDRKKDVIKASGMQVWPRELEEAISKHPAVKEVGVRGFPDAARGEMAVAFVVLRDGMQATEAEIREYCKKQLAPYKVPSRVLFRRDLPKSMVGKVLRRMLTLEEPAAS